jgi:hypothetical protein
MANKYCVMAQVENTKIGQFAGFDNCKSGYDCFYTYGRIR